MEKPLWRIEVYGGVSSEVGQVYQGDSLASLAATVGWRIGGAAQIRVRYDKNMYWGKASDLTYRFEFMLGHESDYADSLDHIEGATPSWLLAST